MTRESSNSGSNSGSNHATYTILVSMLPDAAYPCGPPSLITDARDGSFVDPASTCSLPITTTESDRQVAFVVTKRIEDFAALRTKVYSLAGTAHRGESCRFCAEALRRALWSKSQYFHRNATVLSGLRDDKLLETLAAIVTGLIKICADTGDADASAGATSARTLCQAQRQLPVVMQAFLCGDSC